MLDRLKSGKDSHRDKQKIHFCELKSVSSAITLGKGDRSSMPRPKSTHSVVNPANKEQLHA